MHLVQPMRSMLTAELDEVVHRYSNADLQAFQGCGGVFPGTVTHCNFRHLVYVLHPAEVSAAGCCGLAKLLCQEDW